MSLQNKAIGGYFGLEVSKGKVLPYSTAKKYQSARAAFYSLLLAVKPKRVWMPVYICDSMLSPLNKAGIEICFYGINNDFSIEENIVLKPKDILLYVNYFGVCDKIQKKLLLKYNPEQIVFDHSQAFYTQPKKCLATIYSPRKFFGVPDGGLLCTDVKVDVPEKKDEASYDRSLHLLKRFADDPELGYDDFQRSEESLNMFEPLQMSKLTEELLTTVNYEEVRKIRNDNFFQLHKQLKSINKIKLDIENIDGPMVYPFKYYSDSLRNLLISKRIFVSTYWPECIKRGSVSSNEIDFVKYLFPLSCDQRYSSDDMNRLINALDIG